MRLWCPFKTLQHTSQEPHEPFAMSAWSTAKYTVRLVTASWQKRYADSHHTTPDVYADIFFFILLHSASFSSGSLRTMLSKFHGVCMRSWIDWLGLQRSQTQVTYNINLSFQVRSNFQKDMDPGLNRLNGQ